MGFAELVGIAELLGLSFPLGIAAFLGIAGNLRRASTSPAVFWTVRWWTSGIYGLPAGKERTNPSTTMVLTSNSWKPPRSSAGNAKKSEPISAKKGCRRICSAVQRFRGDVCRIESIRSSASAGISRKSRHFVARQKSRRTAGMERGKRRGKRILFFLCGMRI